ncbi:MAG: hypothetical protein LBM75_04865 [Myxococcales bacterium]|nr:hypothetical protein [Myxococcales bacterium]
MIQPLRTRAQRQDPGDLATRCSLEARRVGRRRRRGQIDLIPGVLCCERLEAIERGQGIRRTEGQRAARRWSCRSEKVKSLAEDPL